MRHPLLIISLCFVLLTVPLFACSLMTPAQKAPPQGEAAQPPEVILPTEAPVPTEAPEPTLAPEPTESEQPTQEAASTEDAGPSMKENGPNAEATKLAEDQGKLSAEAYLKRGDQYLYDQSLYQEAYDDFSHAIAINPKAILAWFHRGVASNAMGQYESALEDFNQAIKLWPGQPNTYGWRGQNYYDMGKYKEALADYDKAIKLATGTNWAGGPNQWAHLYEGKQKVEEALKNQ